MTGALYGEVAEISDRESKYANYFRSYVHFNPLSIFVSNLENAFFNGSNLPKIDEYTVFRDEIVQNRKKNRVTPWYKSDGFKRPWDLFISATVGIYDLARMARIARDDLATFSSIIDDDVVKIACTSRMVNKLYRCMKKEKWGTLNSIFKNISDGKFEIMDTYSIDAKSDYLQNLRTKTWLLACRLETINPIDAKFLPNIFKIDEPYLDINPFMLFEIECERKVIRLNGMHWLELDEIRKYTDSETTGILRSVKIPNEIAEMQVRIRKSEIKEIDRKLRTLFAVDGGGG